MNLKIQPKKLSGSLRVPASKSVTHRALICAALSDGESTIKNILSCEDSDATINALRALGAEISVNGSTAVVKGIKSPPDAAFIDCLESGSTLRFMIPIAAALGVSAEFTGKGKLPTRPIAPFISELSANGITFESTEMPYHITGKLRAGTFRIAGNISSQFISGLLFALPLLDGESEIIITSPLESRPYIDLTIACLKTFGVEILYFNNTIVVKGNQKFKPTTMEVEGDYSQAGFFLVSNMLGSEIKLTNISAKSMQGDRAIVDIIGDMVSYKNTYTCFDIDSTHIPDLVPILTVLGCFADGISHIRNCHRLRIKESDRLEAITAVLNSIGADIRIVNEGLVINGVKSFSGGVCDSYNDHRIAMSLAIAAQRCTEPLTITNSECVAKSYPAFFDDFRSLGGEFDVVML